VHFKTEIGKIYKPASGDREPRNKDPWSKNEADYLNEMILWIEK